VLSVNLQTSRHTPKGYVRTSYTASEIDAVAVYAQHLNACFLMPIDQVAGRRAIHLRLEPTRNNQATGIKWARDYELSLAIKRLKWSLVAGPRP
jgi:hypothetical protein